jgi:transcriptional regulator with XRE-family HTH domain
MPHPIDIYVGRRLRQQRKYLGLSQHKVGEQVGITFQQIQKYERGTNGIRASRLYDLANVLQVPISYFFADYEELGHIFRPQNALDAQTTDKLVGLFMDVPLPRRSQFMELIKTLVSNMAGDEGDT